MPAFNYLELYADASGFRIIVLANRLASDSAFSRAAHDTLIGKLDQLIALARGAMALERKLALNPAGQEADDLSEALWGLGQLVIDHYLDDPDGIDLLHCDVHVDWATKEWYDRRTGQWHFLDGFAPPRIEIGDDRLNGLCAILRQIAAETGIRFNTYATDVPPLAGYPEGDPDSFEALHGLDG